MRRTEYVWNEANRPLSIHLSLDVVSRLGLEAMEAYKAVPRRGLEVGGLLLGRRESVDGHGSIYIHGFQPVESEHRTGPSYKLSEADIRSVEEALGRHPEAVGLYRTQTRDESLSLQKDDADLFRKYFTAPDDLYLLIQPSRGRAAFFLPNQSTADPIHEFPFHASELSGEELAVEEKPFIPPAPAGPVPMPASADLPIREQTKSRSVLRWLVPIAAVLGGMVAGAALYDHFHQTPFIPVNAIAPRPPAPEGSPHIALSVQRDGASIRLFWDRTSPAVRNAAKAILYINDGDHQSQLNLDPKELASGVVSYWPDTKDVSFRLEVFAAGHSTAESIRAVGGVAVPGVVTRRSSMPAARTEPVRPAAPPVSEPVAAAPSAVAGKPSPTGSASRTETAESRPSPFVPAPKPAAPLPAQPISAPMNTPPTRTPMREPVADVSVVAEPIGGSRVGAVIGRIPFVRRLKKQRQTYVPPAPSHEFRPVLTVAERRLISKTVAVDVRVFVGESGKVSYAELLTNAGHHRELASAAVYAARRWDFVPAKLGQERVPGEVILHFKFSPDGPPDTTQ